MKGYMPVFMQASPREEQPQGFLQPAPADPNIEKIKTSKANVERYQRRLKCTSTGLIVLGLLGLVSSIYWQFNAMHSVHKMLGSNDHHDKPHHNQGDHQKGFDHKKSDPSKFITRDEFDLYEGVKTLSTIAAFLFAKIIALGMCGKKIAWRNKFEATQRLHKKSCFCLLIIIITAFFAMHQGKHLKMIVQRGDHQRPDHHKPENHGPRPDHHRQGHHDEIENKDHQKKHWDHKGLKSQEVEQNNKNSSQVSQVKLLSIEGRHLEQIEALTTEEPIAQESVETEEVHQPRRGKQRGHGKRRGRGRNNHGKKHQKDQVDEHHAPRREGRHHKQHPEQLGQHHFNGTHQKVLNRTHHKLHNATHEKFHNRTHHRDVNGTHKKHHNGSHHNGSHHNRSTIDKVMMNSNGRRLEENLMNDIVDPEISQPETLEEILSDEDDQSEEDTIEDYEDEADLDEDEDYLDEEEKDQEPLRGMRAVDRDQRHHGHDGQRQGRHHGESDDDNESESHHRRGKHGRHEPKENHHRGQRGSEGHKQGPHKKHHGHERSCIALKIVMISLIAAHFMIIKALKHYQELHDINTGKKQVACSPVVVHQQPQFVVSAPVQQVYEYSEPVNTSQIREEKDKVVESIFIPNTTIQSDKNNMV